MERKIYNWKQVVSYGLIALHNLLNSANEVNIKNMQIFDEPLQELHSKKEAEKYAEILLNKEK